jgi:hypothetical protein
VLAALALAAFALGLGHASAPVRAHPDERLRPPPARSASALPPASRAPASRAPAVPPPEVEIGINASPWAHVEMDGRALGTTPLGGVRVPAGPHVFRARMADGRWLERRIVIGPGEHTLVFR